MKKSELAAMLAVPREELDGAVISGFNKEVLSGLPGQRFTGSVDETEVAKAEEMLHAFLLQHWPEQPDAHKYVINACLARAYLYEKPMHTREKAGYVSLVEDGKERFYCPLKEKGTVCDFCPATAMDELSSRREEREKAIEQTYGPEAAAMQRLLMEAGFQEAGVIPVSGLAFHDDVRVQCEKNLCGCYGTSWACPPAVGTPEECRQRVLEYRYLHLFSKAYVAVYSRDMSGILANMRDFKKTAWDLGKKLKGVGGKHLILSNESCGRCKECTYPDAPCRFPDELQHSIEGYGFYVAELCKQADIKYINGTGAVTFFGAVLY